MPHRDELQNIEKIDEHYFSKDGAKGKKDEKDPSKSENSGLWPAPNADMNTQFDHYAKIADLFGHKKIEKGKPVLIALRGVMAYANKIQKDLKNVKAYDDTFILLLNTGKAKEVHVFAGATHDERPASGPTRKPR